MPLLNSIPEEVRDINVTMGYPMSASELYVFMSDVAAMQLRIRKKESEKPSGVIWERSIEVPEMPLS